jgi:aspartokinase
VSCAVLRADADRAVDAIVAHTGDYEDVMMLRRTVGIVTVYGDRMKNVPGTSGKVYGALGAAGISIIAAAQGGEELSISMAVDAAEAERAADILRSL